MVMPSEVIAPVFIAGTKKGNRSSPVIIGLQGITPVWLRQLVLLHHKMRHLLHLYLIYAIYDGHLSYHPLTVPYSVET